MNNKYKVTVEAPLIRAGLKIETECSEKYLTQVVDTLINKVREINEPKEPFNPSQLINS